MNGGASSKLGDMLIPLGLLLLGSAPPPGAPAKVRQLRKEAAQLTTFHAGDMRSIGTEHLCNI
jgi:hypothetical protein